MGKYLHLQPALFALYFGLWMQVRLAFGARSRPLTRAPGTA